MSALRILVKLPTRGRPKQSAEVVRKMRELMHGECLFLVSLDSDDPQLGGYVEDIGTRSRIGASESKIHAVNRDINEFDEPWDILVVASDDMWPVAKGWDTIIRNDMAKHFPDLDGMLWYPDGFQKRITTMPIMGRRYYNRFGFVYHPSYRSFWCDNEQTAVAQAHGKIVYIDQQLFEHRHPGNHGTAKRDETYRRADPDKPADKLNFQRRRLAGFPI